MLRLLKYINKKEWLSIAGCLILVFAMVFLELEIPSYMKEITTLLQTGGDAMDIFLQGLFMLLCALGAGGLAVAVKFLTSTVGSKLGERLRKNIYLIVQDMSAKEINKFSIPSLTTRTTNDVNQVQNFISMGIQPILKAPIMAVWALTIILRKSWQWSVVTGAAVFSLVLMLFLIFIMVLPKMKAYQTRIDQVNKVARDNLIGVRVVRAYNAEKYEENKFEKKSEDLAKTDYFITKIMSFLSPGMTLIMSGLTLGIYWVGAVIINQAVGLEKMNLFSDMIVFSSYAMQIVMAFIIFAIIFIMFPRAEVSGRRINQVLKTKNSIIGGSLGDESLKDGCDIEFKNVSFKYEDGEESCLENISFTAKKGETIAIIGATGSGKSSLINLIPRFYDVTGGEILLKGKNIKEYSLKAINNIVGYVSQKPVLFSGTIKSNINLGESEQSETDENVLMAIENAQAGDFVKAKEGKEDSLVLQGGSNFSGGQKQRLSIARAIARQPQILILDDSFSALDYKTDKKLRKTLKEKFANTTTFIVAQRIGTIKDADLIIVLDEGKIVGKGTHNQLMQDCKVYKEIALSQLSKEEL